MRALFRASQLAAYGRTLIPNQPSDRDALGRGRRDFAREGFVDPMTDAQQKLWGIDQLNVPRSDIPAVTHVDYSARVQTVDRETNPNYYDLIAEFERQTGCAVVVNTSFNVRGEPIVCTPADAYRCFMRTHIDYLVMGPFLVDKRTQPAWKETEEWREQFQLD